MRKLEETLKDLESGISLQYIFLFSLITILGMIFLEVLKYRRVTKQMRRHSGSTLDEPSVHFTVNTKQLFQQSSR